MRRSGKLGCIYPFKPVHASASFKAAAVSVHLNVFTRTVTMGGGLKRQFRKASKEEKEDAS